MALGHILFDTLHTFLVPAHWLAGQIGLPDHLPTVELAVGLVFLASCFGLALHGTYAWLRSKHPLPLIAAVVAVAGGVIALLATVTFRHVWLYTLILAIIAADIFWRLLSSHDLPARLRRGGTVWAAASLLLCAGTPSLFLIHTWFTEQSINNQMQHRLTSERDRLAHDEISRVGTSLTKLSTSPELLASTFKAGDPLLLALVQRMSVQEQIPYLVLLDTSGKVLARSQPVAAFGDTWPVTLTDFATGKASGLTLSERNVPVVLVAQGLTIGQSSNAYILVGGSQIDQTYLSTRSTALHAVLFTTSPEGITALAAPEGNAVNALSAKSVDEFLSARWDKAGNFSVASSEKRYLISTLPLIGEDGKTIGTLGTAMQDTSTDFRLRLDLIVMIALAVFVLALPALAWRKKEVTT